MIRPNEREAISIYLANKLKGNKRIGKTSINKHIKNFYQELESARKSYQDVYHKEFSIVYQLDEFQITQEASRIADLGEDYVEKFFNYYALSGVVKFGKSQPVEGDMQEWSLTQRQWNLLTAAIACERLFERGIVKPETYDNY